MNNATDTDRFLVRHLNVQTFGATTVLDAVAWPNGTDRTARVFFRPGPAVESITAGEDVTLTKTRSISEAPLIACKVKGSEGPVPFLVDGSQIEVNAQAPETDLFAGHNVIFAIRNGETSDITMDWLNHHVTHHGMTAALILDRSRPGQDDAYGADLKEKIGSIKGLKRVVLLTSDVPLGKPELPAEAHPFNVRGAPGKDRMGELEPDPWQSPLGDLQIYELARARFLDTARAVATIEICDLLVQEPGQDNIFDRACAAQTGCIQLEGQQCYPWRIRKRQTASFGDHVYVQFDSKRPLRRWCLCPKVAGPKAVWRLVRVVGTDPNPDETATFNRYMILRHPTPSVSKIVPKSSLVESPELLEQAEQVFAHKPVRMKALNIANKGNNPTRTTVVTAMKNEGPFILEWIAYHLAIGVKDFLVYTNDCTDGTDEMLQLLQDKGIVQHRENPFQQNGLKPQQAALMAADKEQIVKRADWLVCIDVDEFINIKVGEGRLPDLIKAVGDSNMIAMTWRLFGNSDVHDYQDRPICETYYRCAAEYTRKPHQAWGFKTLYRNQGIFKKLGVHRPKGLKSQLWEDIKWVNGSGEPLPRDMFRNAWRSTESTYGYDLVSLNHYAVRSAESFLVKRDRGRVNHVDRDQGLAYWFRMNNNAEEDHSIQRMLPVMQEELDKLMADPELAEIHNFAVQKHREKIAELKATPNYAAFYEDITSARMEKLSRMHSHFGANVFLSGPDSIPDEIVEKSPDEDFVFTVEKGKTEH